ncbi:MAG TPA: porin family protein [Lunatimonas sp.]|nr:porin family protein [Lunatimonas sp.]
MNKLTIILIALLISYQANAQEKERTQIGGRPNIAGDLFLDFGFNFLNNRPDDLNTRFFASRIVNIYYQASVPLGNNTGFSFNPGIGLGLEKLAFQDNQTLIPNPVVGLNSSQLADVLDIYEEARRVDKYNISINYIDIPLELRYHVNRTNYNKGFRAAVGGKIGILYNSHTKIAVTDASDTSMQVKNRQDYGFSPIRYGVFTRLGFPGFSVWSYYGLNSVFEEGKGPFSTEASQFNLGLSVTLF